MENASTSWQTWKTGDVPLVIPRWTGPEDAAHAWNGDLWEATAPVGGVGLIRTDTRLICAFRAPVHEARVLIDPVGDLLSFYEFRADAHGRGSSALWRESRSGHLVDARWATSATYTPDARGLVISVPFTDTPPAMGAAGEVWKVALQSVSAAGDSRAAVREVDFIEVELRH